MSWKPSIEKEAFTHVSKRIGAHQCKAVYLTPIGAIKCNSDYAGASKPDNSHFK